ncbi:28285_t:CDS:2, partial [Gigaspora margarita]
MVKKIRLKIQKLKKKIVKKFYDVEVPEQITDMQDSLEMMLRRGDIQTHNYVEFSDFNEICIEKIALKEFTRHEDRILVNELKRHIKVNNHENIIKFLGITARLEAPANNYIIVLQFANGGNLKDYLGSKSCNGIFEILWTELIQIAEQIIFGIKHLHDNNMVHGNLA